ncbi:putative galactolipase [Dioscorea sansibarensis]
MAAWIDPSIDMDKLSYEIFSILETKFLFGYDDAKLLSIARSPPETPTKVNEDDHGKVRILSIDGCGDSDGLLAAVTLAQLESSLRRCSGDPSARIVDFFDLAAGSGLGGVLAALLFSSHNLSAADALEFLAKHHKKIASLSSKKSGFRSMIGGSGSGIFRRIFGDSTIKEAAKPLLVPCYDLETGASFMFSRADAVEMDGYDFMMRHACEATCAGNRSVRISSADGRTRIAAVGAPAAGMGNPAAAAITHVLNNKQEFPRANGFEDLLVLSIGGGNGGSPPSNADGAADMVDQAVAMAFGQSRTTNYVRIQANGLQPAKSKEAKVAAAMEALKERNMVSVLFRGSKLSAESNAEKLEMFASELIGEQERRKRSKSPTVVIKQAMTPRTSSATTSTTATSCSSSVMTSPRLRQMDGQDAVRRAMTDGQDWRVDQECVESWDCFIVPVMNGFK